MNYLLRCLIVLVSMTFVLGGPMKLYKKTDGNTYERVLIPVSSTYIPLDDLPQFKVGVGLGFVTPDPLLVKPLGDHKLLTVKDVDKKAFQKKSFKKTKSGAVAEEIPQ